VDLDNDVSPIDELTMEDRARTYAMLADAFSCAPTQESTSAVCQVAQALGISSPNSLSLEEIEREFMDLLIVPNPRYVAPYESAYRDRWMIPGPDGAERSCTGLLMGDSTEAVRQAFADAGVRPLRDLPDHIANELRLVGHLWHVEACADTPSATEAARQRQLFVADHLLQWVRELGGKIAQTSGTGFYRVAMDVAHALLRAETATDNHHGDVAPEVTTT
jgi:TorA maturation chaperone TorD